jgi:hypothetical protein
MLDILTVEDVRNVILAANAAVGEIACRDYGEGGVLDGAEGGRQVYEAGFEAALAAVAAAFGIPLSATGRLRTAGVVIPGGRLAVSYRAEQSLRRLMMEREEFVQ